MDTTRDRILSQARGLLRGGTRATVDQIARAAGVSRTSFYRAFESRDALLEALEVTPEPGARQRLLDAALEMVGAHGLSALSMDALADRAEVSRATLYRLFPGKSALFTALVTTYSPLEPVIGVLTAMRDQPHRDSLSMKAPYASSGSDTPSALSRPVPGPWKSVPPVASTPKLSARPP